MDQNERRREKRKYLLYYTRVFDTQSHMQVGNLVDITARGAMLITHNPIPMDVNFNLKLELSDEVSDQPFMEISAQSLWCHADIDPALFNSGFKFLEVSPKNAQIIKTIVETFGFRDN
jgi:c-di-GMP-binding flagellar brake protein YcgR